VNARILVADPPWKFSDKLPGGKRGAEKHYRCMTVSEIMRTPLPPIHENAVLFLWRVSSMVEEAYQVVRAWDFTPKSEIVWNKTGADGTKDRIGMGRIVRGSHETCVVATRGKPIETASKRERTSFRAPLGQHSEKPEEFYQIVERLYPLELWREAHVELFARKRRNGWIQLGDQLPAGEPRTCIVHGLIEPGRDVCRECLVTGLSAELQTLLAPAWWHRTSWSRVTSSVRAEARANGAMVP
jgi:N6-adenosine-specific RNA methylase IME4